MAMQNEREDSRLFPDEDKAITDIEAEEPNVQDRSTFPEEPNTVTDPITDIEAETQSDDDLASLGPRRAVDNILTAAATRAAATAASGANEKDEDVEDGTVALSATPAPPTSALGFTFTPGGLLFPYHVGVAYTLQELGLLTEQTPVGGSSAGAIVAAAIACGVSEASVLAALAALVEDVRGGTRLNVALRKQLELILDDSAAEAAQRHGLRLCYLEVLPRPRGCVVSEFRDKSDLIEVIIASCNWPLFFSRWPFVVCRGAWALDGYFAVGRDRFGCPPLPATRVVACSALPRVRLPAFGEADLIQPGRDDASAIPVDDAEWFGWALAPASDERLEEMVELGRRHARAWAAQNAGSL